MTTRVLFLCTGNSARSQMAEGLLRQMGEEGYEVVSAGTKPVGLNPLAVAVMGELGIDIAAQQSKDVKPFLGERFAYVITLCDSARQSCPVFPGAFRRLHWDLPDPAASPGSEAERREAFRAVRDELRRRIEAFLGERR